ncbi:MAG TPA: alpha/beta hydrolase domain-containing protein [Bryobacteraceae bacterium]|nr:alpha/beta hydrolase domain-containing protein [Bryobacteraceae bacterium]
MIWRILAGSLVGMLMPAPSAARVVRLTIESRESPPYARNYERLTGRFLGELDPADALNAIINDIALAPRNARGKVEYSATFTLLRPLDPAKASGVLWYEVPNRGNSPLNPQPSPDALRAGHVVLSSGWQGDLAPRAGVETITVPAAHNADGSSITGPVLARMSNLPAHSSTASLEGGFSGLHYQRPATLDTRRALLTKQASDDGQVIPVPAQDWVFANCQNKPFPGEPDPARICLKDGFDADLLYQVVYTAKDPLVLGIGLAATRDIVSFFRYADKDDNGTANPVAGLLKQAIAFGTSQSGNFLKTFVHLGFNQDEARRRVWDGINPNIAARQTPLNFRFAIPGGAANLYEPGSEGVLWWGTYRDAARGRNAASLLDRCRATKSCPKIMETFGSTEFWGLRMSPGLVGTSAQADIPLPPEVRRYYFPGVTHGGGRGGFDTAARPGRGCLLPDNPNPSAETMRALRLALTTWVTKNVPPPPSRYPTLAKGELAAPQHAAMDFPAIPGQPLPDNLINPFLIYDFGASFRYNDLSGAIAMEPPLLRGIVPLLVPRTDADGNEVGGVPSVLHQAPLGTYLGWNVTAGGYLKGRGCGFTGGFIPFVKTKAERESSGDPRPSLEERYGSHDGYVRKVREAAHKLQLEGFLLADDAEKLVKQAEESAVLR